MTVFLIVAIILTAGAVLAIVVPLLRKPKTGSLAAPASAPPDAVALSLGVLREQLADLEREYAAGRLSAETYAQEKSELEQRALEDARHTAPAAANDARRPKLALGIGLAVPVVVLGAYFLLGSPDALDGKKQAAPPAGGQASHALTPQQIVGMVERLSERLQDNPNDGAGWQMLARSYGVLGRYAESAAAYGRAVSLLPPDAQLLADLADTLAMTQGRRLQGQPEAVVRQALAVDPRNVKALALSGTLAFERKDYAAAIGEWRKILAVVPEDSSVSTSIRASIADAEVKMGAGAATPRPASKGVVETTISGSVVLDAGLRKKVDANDVVFVFARAAEGPRMPLAILRKRVSDLPFEFSLDDSMAMTPNFKLSQFDKLIVGARVSKTGDALPREGDFEGLSTLVAPGARNIRISIRSEVK